MARKIAPVSDMTARCGLDARGSVRISEAKCGVVMVGLRSEKTPSDLACSTAETLAK